MAQCPVCQTELGENIPGFCKICGWETGEDINLHHFLNAPSAYEMEKYNRRLENAKRIWAERKKAESEKIEFQRRLEEKMQKELEAMKALFQTQLDAMKQPVVTPVASNTTSSQVSESGNMLLVEGGTFQMGSTNGFGDQKPIHSVTLSSFYMGKYPVTQKEWQAVMGSNPSNFKGDKRPVEQITWYQAVEFCNKLSQKEGLTPAYTIDKSKKDSTNNNEYDNVKWIVTVNWQADGYRLPTEAEWEFAARGGKLSKGYTYSGSNNLDEVGWYDSNSGNQTKDVGTKRANELGIYDMSGNVWEWCWDWYANYSSSSETNPRGATSGSSRVLRGGSWNYRDGHCRVALRSRYNPDNSYIFIGFRLSRTIR